MIYSDTSAWALVLTNTFRSVLNQKNKQRVLFRDASPFILPDKMPDVLFEKKFSAKNDVLSVLAMLPDVL